MIIQYLNGILILQGLIQSMTITRCILFSCLATVLLANSSCFSKKITSKPVAIVVLKDSDLDGVNDIDDKCPEVKGFITLEGCPDIDGDGIADYLDKCPELAGQARYLGCPVPDTDKDGINDDADVCPTVFGYARYQGCLIPDSDGDGVNDEEDKCVQEAGPTSNRGCPLINKSDSISSQYAYGDDVNDLGENIKTGKKPRKKLKNLPLSNNPETTKYNNGLTSNKPAHGTGKTKKTSADQTITVSVNPATSDSSLRTASPDSASRFDMLRVSFPNTIPVGNTKKLVIDLFTNEIPLQPTKQTNVNNQGIEKGLPKNNSIITYDVPSVATYKKLTISFLNNEQALEITPLVPEEQGVDLINGNSFRWNIKSLKSKPGSDTITLIVNAETAAGLKLNVVKQQINIKISPEEPASFLSVEGKWPAIVGSISLLAICLFLFAVISKKKKQAAGSDK